MTQVYGKTQADAPRRPPSLAVTVAKIILCADLCLLPLLLAAILMSPWVSRFLDDSGLGVAAFRNVGFLQRQLSIFAARGIDPGIISADLRLFACFVWLSLPVLALRLLSGPFLFHLVDETRPRVVKSLSTQLVVGWMVAGPLALFGSIDGSPVAPQLTFIFERAPRGYVRLLAFVFVGSAMFTIEGILLALRVLIKRKRDLNHLP